MVVRLPCPDDRLDEADSDKKADVALSDWLLEDLVDEPPPLAFGMETVNDALPLFRIQSGILGPIGAEARKIDSLRDRIDVPRGSYERLVDGFGTPDEICAVFKREEAGGAFA